MEKYEPQTNPHTLYQRIIKISEKFRPSNFNIEENLCDLGLGKEFLDMTPKQQSIRGKTGK